MKALEYLLIQELDQLHALESKLHGAFAALKDASTDQVSAFIDGLADLDRHANRLERMLDGMDSTPLAA